MPEWFGTGGAWVAAGQVVLVWSAITIGLYAATRRLYRRLPRWWSAPVLLTPLLLIAITLLSHTDYAVYSAGTHWLLVLLGPATVAFAVPIYHRRQLMARYWRTLCLGVLGSSAISMVSAWWLASAFGVDGTLRLSLLPRSVSTPFAMVVSGKIGGVPELTALFVMVTGIFGATFGEALLALLPLKTKLARGASFGLAAHVVGSNKAHQIHPDEGAIAALVMVLTGICNVLFAPVLQAMLG